MPLISLLRVDWVADISSLGSAMYLISCWVVSRQNRFYCSISCRLIFAISPCIALSLSQSRLCDQWLPPGPLLHCIEAEQIFTAWGPSSGKNWFPSDRNFPWIALSRHSLDWPTDKNREYFHCIGFVQFCTLPEFPCGRMYRFIANCGKFYYRWMGHYGHFITSCFLALTIVLERLSEIHLPLLRTEMQIKFITHKVDI